MLKPKLFQLKVELKGEKAFKLNGSLTLPVKQDWLRICDSPELVDAFGKPCSADELTSKLARIWKRPVMRDLAHAPVRREFSLPAIDNPSGASVFAVQTCSAMSFIKFMQSMQKNIAVLHLQAAMLIGQRGSFLTSFSTKI